MRRPDLKEDIQGELYDQLASNSGQLRWSPIQTDLILPGGSEMSVLSNMKNILLALRQQSSSSTGPTIILQSQKKNNFEERLLLLESEVEGLMKRKINYSDGNRTLDYSNLLNEKQNQVVELEKKINNLEVRLRKLTARQLQLQNHIQHLHKELSFKEHIINSKNQIILAEVASSNAMKEAINKLKKNLSLNKSRIGEMDRIILEGVIIPEIGSFEIKADSLIKDGAQVRTHTYSSSSQSAKLKTKIVQLFRQFERTLQAKQQVRIQDVERSLEGFLGELRGTRLYESVQLAIKREKIEENYRRLKDNFAAAASIYQQGIEQLRIEHPNIRINFERNLFDILQRENVQTYRAENGAIFVNDYSQKTVEVPVQDTRTKHLLHLFASELKRLSLKFPKIKDNLDQKVSQLFEQEFIDLIDVDEVGKLVDFVKYKTQVVKVENVYAYSSEKSRKVEFHLRILIKALLEELHKLKAKTNYVPEMDEGVIGMIKQEIMGVVDVEDILKVFRVVPKIVEVEKVVERIVEKVVEIPTIVTVEKIVEKIVEVEKIKEVQKIEYVPLDVPTTVDVVKQKVVPLENYSERVVEVPTTVEKIVDRIVQTPKIIEVEVEKQKIVEIDRIVEVERVVNHIEKEYEKVEIAHDKIVPVERVEERIVEVEVFVDRIVEKRVEVPKIIEVEKIVEKIVKVVEYQNAREVINHVQVEHEIVEKVVEKPVYITKVEQKILEVPKIVEKIVQVTNVETKIQQVEVFRDKIVMQDRIVEVEVPNTQIVEVLREVPREIQKTVQIPLIEEKIKVVKEYVEIPVIQTVERVELKEIYLRDPLVVYEPKIVEVEKSINHYLEVPKPFKYIEQKIVEVPQIKQKIKEVKVMVEKLVEKMVEVPKVVEVEKVVEKVVVVPRVVERVVEIPKIVEVAVEKEIIKQTIKEVEKRVEVPIFYQKPYEVEKLNNIFIEVEKIVDRYVDKLVVQPTVQQKVEIQNLTVERVVEVIREIPKYMEVERIVPLVVQEVKVIEIDRPIITPVEVPVVVDRYIDRVVVQQEIRERIRPQIQVIQKIVTVKEQEVIVQEVEKFIDRIIIEKKIQQIEKIIPYIEKVVESVPTIVQKIVAVESTVQEIVTAQQIVEKVVDRMVEVPKVVQVEKVKEVLVEVPKFIEIQRVVPQLVKVNNYIQKVVDKIVQIPLIVQEIKEVERIVEKVVSVENNVKEVIEVDRLQDKIVIVEKMKEVVKYINYVQKVLQIQDRLEQIPVPVTTKEEILVEVPYILEKIVQKIVVMPQIVEVLKYVTQVCETDSLGVAVDSDASKHEYKFQSLSKNIKSQLDALLRELRYMASTNSQVKSRVNIIEKFLIEFQKYLEFPRIIKGIEEKIVEKEKYVEKVVTMPVQDEKSVKMELTLSLLVQKLIMELKRIRNKTQVNLELDEDIKLIFFEDLKTQSKMQGGFSALLQSYSAQSMRQIESLGEWGVQNQLMLNSFLQQRFLMAEVVHNANREIQIANEVGQKRLEGLRRYKKDRNYFETYLMNIKKQFKSYDPELQKHLEGIRKIVEDFQSYSHVQTRVQTTHSMGELSDTRYESKLRQKQQEILRLKDCLLKKQHESEINDKNAANSKIKDLEMDNIRLRSKVNDLETRSSEVVKDSMFDPLKEQIRELQEVNFEFEKTVSELRQSNYNLENENKLLRDLCSGEHNILNLPMSPNRRSDGHDLSRSTHPRQDSNLQSRTNIIQSRTDVVQSRTDVNVQNVVQSRTDVREDSHVSSRRVIGQSAQIQSSRLGGDINSMSRMASSGIMDHDQSRTHIPGATLTSSNVRTTQMPTISQQTPHRQIGSSQLSSSQLSSSQHRQYGQPGPLTHQERQKFDKSPSTGVKPVERGGQTSQISTPARLWKPDEKDEKSEQK